MTTQAPVKKTMRDAFLEQVLNGLDAGENIYFLSADFGAPVLDLVRDRHPNRFINVGIAEQNLINVACGLGLEGFTVYAYAIAPFLSMRCYEQIRLNLAVLSQLRPMNVNLIAVGAGFSYDVSGPTHHCLEDLSIMRTLPNMQVISPADWNTAQALYRHTADTMGPKYLRFDAKPHIAIHDHVTAQDLKTGYIELKKGKRLCLLATGYLTQKAMEAVRRLEALGHAPGLIDMIMVKGFDEAKLLATLSKYERVITLEEGFIGKGGLDAAIATLINEGNAPTRMKAMGLKDQYTFHIGSRESLHAKNGLDLESILAQAAI